VGVEDVMISARDWPSQGPCRIVSCISKGLKREWKEKGGSLFGIHSRRCECSRRFRQKNRGEVSSHDCGCVVEAAVSRHLERPHSQCVGDLGGDLLGFGISGDGGGNTRQLGQGDLGTWKGHERMEASRGSMGTQNVHVTGARTVEQDRSSRKAAGDLADGPVGHSQQEDIGVRGCFESTCQVNRVSRG
jgi:hypothetical protein